MDTVGKNKKAVEEYIRNIKEYINPFEKEKKERKIKKGIGPLKW